MIYLVFAKIRGYDESFPRFWILQLLNDTLYTIYHLVCEIQTKKMLPYVVETKLFFLFVSKKIKISPSVRSKKNTSSIIFLKCPMSQSCFTLSQYALSTITHNLNI